MPDENHAAASSPVAAAEPAIPSDSAGYAEWRMTGKTPETAPPKASPPKSAAAAPAKEEHSETAPASEPGKTQEKKTRPNAETRLNELLADLKTAGFTPAELKTYKREAQTPKTEPKTEPKAAPEQTEKPATDEGAPKKPKQDDFDTWEKYEAARDEYQEKLADYKAQQQINKFRAEQAAEAQRRETEKKLNDAKARYGDEAQPTIIEAAKAIFNDQKVPAVIHAMLNESDVLTDVLYTMGSKAEVADFVELAKTNPGAAVRRLALIEHLVKEELAKPGAGSKAAKPAAEEPGETPKRDESGKFTPAKKVTEAPPPPRETSGHAAPPADEVDAAAKANDFRRFRDAANRKDLSRRRGN